jgi:hypothetical protein
MNCFNEQELLTIKTLCKRGLSYAVKNNDIDCVKLCLKLKVDVDELLEKQLLCESVSHGHTEITKILIEVGADINKTDKYGETPLHRVVYNGRTEIARMLIKVGADVNIPNRHGQTPLYWAACDGHTEIAKMLIEAKVDVNKADEYGCTPLYWAAKKKEHLDIMTLLLCEKPTGAKELKDLPADSEDLIKDYLRCNQPKSVNSHNR